MSSYHNCHNCHNCPGKIKYGEYCYKHRRDFLCDEDDIIIHKEIIAEVRRSIRELKLQETYDGIAKVDQEIPNMNKGFLK